MSKLYYNNIIVHVYFINKLIEISSILAITDFCSTFMALIVINMKIINSHGSVKHTIR